MSAEVIPFRRSCAVIECGDVQEILPTGKRTLPRFILWVDYYDEEGCRFFMAWSGRSYREAQSAAAEWDVPVVDHVRGRI